MQSFLNKVAAEITKNHPEGLENIAIVLPNRRSNIFLKKEIAKNLKSSSWSPEIYSLEDFVSNLSPLDKIDQIDLLFELYNVHSKIESSQKESLDEFINWGSILIQDFNEIDRYDINGHDIFNYLSSVKELEHWSVQDEKTDLVSNYLVFWKHITTYYNTLKEQLLHQNLGYQGLIYRMAKNNIETYKANTDKTHVFLGFNALNRCEEIIFKSFKNSNKGLIIWDLDQYFFDNKHHAAGTFLRQLNKANLMDNQAINNLENTLSLIHI